MIWLIRHGQTNMNIARRLQGRRDEPLNETGREQAEKAAEWFRSRGIRFDRVISSPLQRAADTARILAGEDAPFRTDDRLMEIDCGPWDLFHNPAPEGMETLSHVEARLGAFLSDLKGEIGPEETVLVSTHAIALKGALENLDPRPDGGWWNYPVHNCCGYVFSLINGAYTKPAEYDTQN